ncbi:hypothetical protein FS594_10930 [Rahnella aquatilis]|uniref:hemagglutinin repeat-containing protein n=1 Tax=Rahnella perminowiae TaxID=2816244 RepID=UPI001C271BBE|nr:hemagglutinin repeat-containing protein [Rahnella perminowiae]MBU9828174.1 hemagglutinin repeat-containing protein [Rahnella perminowiae]UJD89255.1 hypothetical protein FS594_10930 [Rahnella aquatilis]
MPGTGSGITGNNVTLAAQNDLLLKAASNNSKQTSGNNASGWSARVPIFFRKRGVNRCKFCSK